MTPQEEAMENLRDEVANKCIQIEDLAQKRFKLPLTRVTVIARDPGREKMYLVVSNEDDRESLLAAVRLLTNPPAGEKNIVHPDADVELIENVAGTGHGAWDMVDPKDIILAAWGLLKMKGGAA